MKGYLTELLVNSGELKPTFSAEDIRLPVSGKYVVSFSDELKDIVRNRLGEGYLYINLVLKYIQIIVSNRYLNRAKFISDISTILGNDISNQYCDIIIGIMTKLSYRIMTNGTFNNIVLNNYVCDLEDLINIMTVLLVECFDMNTIRSWTTIKNTLDDWIKFQVFVQHSGEINTASIGRASLGLLSTLDIDTKKNIIGSIWNCIIDIINEISINDISEEQEEGGVVNG